MSVLHERTSQLVACAFHLTTNSRTVAARFDDQLPSARQDHPVTSRHRFSVVQQATGLVVSEDEGGGTRLFQGGVHYRLASLTDVSPPT